MKVFFKRMLLLLLSVLMAVNLTSCFLFEEDHEGNIDRDGNPLFAYNYEDYESQEVRDLLETLFESLDTTGEHDRVLTLYSNLTKGLYRIRSQYVAAMISYNKNLYSEELFYEERYLKMSALYDEITAMIYKLYAEAYSTEYEEIFFGGLTEGEISDILKMAKCYDEEYVQLAAEYDALVSEYYDIEIIAGESDAKVAELYAKVIDVNNRIAKKFGYDNYLDYSYDLIYGREYAPEDVETVVDHCISYLIPVLEKAKELSDKKKISKEIYYYYYESALDGKAREELDAYFLSLGTSLNGAYKKFHDYGLYVASSETGLSYEAAFTDYFEDCMLPVCYFGPYYQDRLTVVHELGHFTHGYLTNNAPQSYDVAELNSQGNEMLFLAYESGKHSADFYAGLMQGEIFDMISTILMAELINAFEYAVYTAEDVDGASILVLFDQVCERFGGREVITELLDYDVSQYWQYVVVTQPGYYISYAVSGISALELYTVAMTDYERAVEMYETTVSQPIEGLSEMLVACGLSSPFEKTLYEQLSSRLLSMNFLQ